MENKTRGMKSFGYTRETPLEETHISTRARNALRRGGCYTVGDVAELGMGKVVFLRGIGVKNLDEIGGMLEGMAEAQ
jgi:DNA-directed RNA polymerase alpha subunit